MSLRQRLLRALAIILTVIASGGVFAVADRLQLLELLLPTPAIVETK